MNNDKEFCEYVVYDLLGNMSDIRFRRMFGAYGLYQAELFFGIIEEGELYLKVDDSNRADYEALESHPFIYMKEGKEASLSFWSVPADVLEDRVRLEEWVEKSIDVARSKKKKK